MSYGMPKPASMAFGAGPAQSLSMAAIEVTQAIQNDTNAVPLIAGKPTVVRVYLDSPAGTQVAVRGEIAIMQVPKGVEQVIPSLNSVVVDPAQNGLLRTKREKLGLSLNFAVPARLLTPGRIAVRVSALIERDSGTTVPCTNCESRVQVQLDQAPALRVRLIGLRYTAGNPPVAHAPSPTDFRFINSWLRRAYPVAEVVSSHVTVDANPRWPFVCGQANAQIAAIRALDVAAGMDRRTHYYGLVSDGGGFMRGCANVPATANPAAVGSGPTGRGSFDWDFDGCYGDWYTGHELGHTFGRRHPGFCNGNSSDDSAYPFPNGQLARTDGIYVGFDMGDAALGIPMAALPGTTHHDVMTYCRNQWLSSYTYEGILRRLREEDALGSGNADDGAGMDPEAITASKRLEVKMESGALISIVGSVDLTQRTGQILYVSPVDRALIAAHESEARAGIRVLADDGRVLGEYPAALMRNTCADDDEHETAVLDTVIPRHADAARVELLLDGRSVDVYQASGSPPRVEDLRIFTEGDSVSVASSPEKAGAADPAIRYNVQISADEGATWQTVAVGRPTPDVTIHPADVGLNTRTVLVRVSATNGFTTSDSWIETVSVDRK